MEGVTQLIKSIMCVIRRMTWACCKFLISMQHLHVLHSFWMPACWPVASFALHDDVIENKHVKEICILYIYLYIFSCPPPHLFLFIPLPLVCVSHFSFVFCLICLPSANAFHPRVCGLQPLQPSGLQQPPAGRELRRLQQGNELMGGFGKNKQWRVDAQV